jgi:alpha-tubulin suppressor-like RCC1 family protein
VVRPEVVQLAGGGYSAYAVGKDGSVWAWGDDLEGQLGNGTDSAISLVPVRVLRLSGVVAVAASANSAYALQGNGSVWAWGDNATGELGTGNEAYTSELPVEVRDIGRITLLAAGDLSAYALQQDGTVWAWGNNAFGQLGRGVGSSEADVPVEVRGLSDVEGLAAGANAAYALSRGGTVWAWGDNTFGELARRAGALVGTSPVKVTQLTQVSAIAASAYTAFALEHDGTVWSWGDGSFGELGDGDCKQASSACPPSSGPVLVRTLNHVIAIAAGGYAAYALESNGSVWAWGDGAEGQLGDRSIASADVTVRVIGLRNVVAIAAGGSAAYALENNGSVWAWGDGDYGQLGDGAFWGSDVPQSVEFSGTPRAPS